MIPEDPELEDLQDRSPALLAQAIQAMVEAVITKQSTKAIQKRIAEIMGDTLTLAHLLGSESIFNHIEDIPEKFAALPPNRPMVVSATFQEAFLDIIDRTPLLADDDGTGRPRWQIVQDIYLEHGFSAAKAIEESVLGRVREVITSSLLPGEDRTNTEPAKVISELADWSRAYATTVYRTNITTAFAAGRLQQAMDPKTKGIIPALRFVAVGGSSGDGDTRPNHAAAHGFVAAPESAVWDDLSPPLGYNCRCRLEPIDKFRARREGLLDADGNVIEQPIPSGAKRDDGFNSGRPDFRPPT